MWRHQIFNDLRCLQQMVPNLYWAGRKGAKLHHGPEAALCLDALVVQAFLSI